MEKSGFQNVEVLSQQGMGPADAAVIATRKLLMDSIQTIEDSGEPVGIQPSYYGIRAADLIFPPKQDWHETLLGEMHPVENSSH